MTLRHIETASQLADVLNRRVVFVADHTDALGQHCAAEAFTHYRIECRKSEDVYLVERTLWDEGVAAGMIRLVAKLAVENS